MTHDKPLRGILLLIAFVVLNGCRPTAGDFVGGWVFQSGVVIISCLGDTDVEDATGEELDIIASSGSTPILMHMADEEDCAVNLSLADHAAVSVPGQSCDFPPDETAIDFEHINILFALNDDRVTGFAALSFTGTLNYPEDSTDQCTVSSFGPVEKQAGP